MQSSFPRPTHTGPLISSLAVVHNPHSTNSKKGKLENKNLVMSFPSLNTITLRKEFRAGAVNTVQSYCSFDAHGTQAPTCAVPFAGLANLIPVSALSPSQAGSHVSRSCAADFPSLHCYSSKGLPSSFRLEHPGINTFILFLLPTLAAQEQKLGCLVMITPLFLTLRLVLGTFNKVLLSKWMEGGRLCHFLD